MKTIGKLTEKEKLYREVKGNPPPKERGPLIYVKTIYPDHREGEFIWLEPLPPQQPVSEYPIALITPYKRAFDNWVHDFGIHVQEYRQVNCIDNVRGVYFSAIQPGLQAWKVDSDIVDAARCRVRPSIPHPPEKKAPTVEGIKKLETILYNVRGMLIPVSEAQKAIHALYESGEREKENQ